MKKLESKVMKFLKDRQWHNLRPVDVAKSIMIEGAELLELFQRENLSLDEVKKDKAKMAEIEKELADVFIYCLDMAVLIGLDSEKIITRKLNKVSKKYPANLFKNLRNDPGAADHKAYWKIKKSHRKRGL